MLKYSKKSVLFYKAIFLIEIILCFVLFTFCTTSDDEGAAVREVLVSPASVSIIVGETQTITVTVNPANANQKVSWVSSNNAVATVSDGVITALSSGTAIITVSSVADATKKATVLAAVDNSVVKSVSILPATTVFMNVGEAQTFTATATPDYAPQQVLWTSSDDAVATVSEGVVTAIAAGRIFITATSAVDATKKATVMVNVDNSAVKGVSISPATPVSISIGETQTLTATVTPAQISQQVTWTSSNTMVATVANGQITAVLPGTAVITAASMVDATKTATVPVTVTIKPYPGDTGNTPYPGGSGQFTHLVWSDEFNGTGLPDKNKWSTADKYAPYPDPDRTDLTRQEGGGLILTSILENGNPVSGAVTSLDRSFVGSYYKAHGAWTYGRMEARVKVSAFIGSFPAVWMKPLGQTYGGGWNSGEIDIMEFAGCTPSVWHFTCHSLKYHDQLPFRTGEWTDPTASSAFHICAIEWFEDRIDWFFDDHKAFTVFNDEHTWEAYPYDIPFYLILNMNVTNSVFGCTSMDVTKLPQSMLVDYVRVFQ